MHGLGGAMSETREWTIKEFVAESRPPTDDNVPMTVDWTRWTPARS